MCDSKTNREISKLLLWAGLNTCRQHNDREHKTISPRHGNTRPNYHFSSMLIQTEIKERN